MNDFIEINRLFKILLRRWWLLVSFTIIAATAGYIISQRQTPVYEARVTVLVGEMTQTSNVSRDDVQISSLFAQTYADLAVRQPVLQGVMDSLHLEGTWEELKKQVRVASIEGTQLIEIIAEADSPELAQSIAGEVANHLILLGPNNVGESNGGLFESFIKQQMTDAQMRILNGQKRIKEIDTLMGETNSTSKLVELQAEKANLERLVADLVLNYVELSKLATQDKKPNSLSIIETAYAIEDPVRPRAYLNILLSGGLGVLLALGIIFLWGFLDDGIHSLDDLTQIENLNILGSVGRINIDPSSFTRESYRRIRNKIQLGTSDNPVRSIVITSPEPGEGRSITAVNLGIIMAQANIRTILVDADMRNPILHDLFNVANKNGLSNLLESSTMDILDCVKNTRIENLQIITSGASSHDQSDQLLSERISEILDHLKGHTDLIIMDSPPALLAADAIILSTRADGVITVARVGKSRRKAIRQLLKDLQEVNANVLGCICNEIKNGNGLAVSKQNKPRKKLSYRPRSLSTYLTGLRTATRQFGAVFIKLLKHNNN